MTTKEKLKKFLTDNGMFEEQADAVLEVAIPQIEALVPDYSFTWERPANEYPPVLYAVMLSIVKEEAVKWIDANLPMAWYRPMFI